MVYSLYVIPVTRYMTDRSNGVLLICIPCNSLYDWSFQWCTPYMYPLYLVMTDRSKVYSLYVSPVTRYMTDRSNDVLLICIPCNSLWLIVPMMYSLYVCVVNRLWLIVPMVWLLICIPCKLVIWLLVPMVYSLYISPVTRYNWSFQWCTPYMYPM